MREIFLLKAGGIEMIQTGTRSKVLENGDFFEIRNHIEIADVQAGKKVPVVMLHTHPRGVERLSQDDIDTLIGMRFGLDRDFVAGIVFLNNRKEMRYKLFNIVLKNKKASIVQLSILKNFWFGVRFNLLPSLQKLVKLSNYE